MKMQQVDFSSLYFGTPVAILSSQNPDGSTNLSPISSWWILEKHIVFGLGASGKAYENIMQNLDIVLNLPDSTLWRNIELIADKTGKENLSENKNTWAIGMKKISFHVVSLIKKNDYCSFPANKRVSCSNRGPCCCTPVAGKK